MWYYRIVRTENVRFLLSSSLLSNQGIPNVVLRLYFSSLHLFVGIYGNASPLPVILELDMTSVHSDTQLVRYGAEVQLERTANNSVS